MRLAASAWKLRGEARAALLAGAVDRAAALAEMAQGHHATAAGESLWRVARLLAARETGA
jgi:hypothetical protein